MPAKSVNSVLEIAEASIRPADESEDYVPAPDEILNWVIRQRHPRRRKWYFRGTIDQVTAAAQYRPSPIQEASEVVEHFDPRDYPAFQSQRYYQALQDAHPWCGETTRRLFAIGASLQIDSGFQAKCVPDNPSEQQNAMSTLARAIKQCKFRPPAGYSWAMTSLLVTVLCVAVIGASEQVESKQVKRLTRRGGKRGYKSRNGSKMQPDGTASK